MDVLELAHRIHGVIEEAGHSTAMGALNIARELYLHERNQRASAREAGQYFSGPAGAREVKQDGDSSEGRRV